jgi:hypothetical protein
MKEDDVLELAREIRERLEPLWKAWRRDRDRPEPSAPSVGMCRFSAQLLTRRLNDAGAGEWIVRGGAPQADYGIEAFRHLKAGDGGIRDVGGSWQGHYWAFRPVDGTIADVTADQFGYPAVLVTLDDSMYRHNYKDASLKRHLREASATPARWASEIEDAEREAGAAYPGPR